MAFSVTPNCLSVNFLLGLLWISATYGEPSIFSLCSAKLGCHKFAPPPYFEKQFYPLKFSFQSAVEENDRKKVSVRAVWMHSCVERDAIFAWAYIGRWAPACGWLDIVAGLVVELWCSAMCGCCCCCCLPLLVHWLTQFNWCHRQSVCTCMSRFVSVSALYHMTLLIVSLIDHPMMRLIVIRVVVYLLNVRC